MKAPTVESSFVLDSRAFTGRGSDLVDGGVLALPGKRFAWDLKTTYFIDLVVQPPMLYISAKFLDRRVEEPIKIILVPRHFGGSQLYFGCPGSAAGACGRRAMKLYLPLQRPTRFACRRCHRLTYETAQSKGTRAAATVARVRALAASTAAAIPRREHAELYDRYRALADALDDVYFVGRLGTYKYYNMDQVVGQALTTYRRIREGASQAA